ncbi:MAG: hypothetical protein J5858_15730, partial [Lentisphaeria bacterium]|nr:hypothetical protein [Lentisphaeria bacterium]
MKLFNDPIERQTGRQLLTLLFSCLGLLLSSCQSDFWNWDDQDSEKKSSKEEKKEKTQEEKDKERFAFLQDEKAKYKARPKDTGETIEQELVTEEKAPAEILQKKAEQISKIRTSALEPKKEKPKAALHFYDDFIILNGDEEIEVNLVFNNAPLLDVLPSFADALGFNFLADSDLKGNVTLNIDQKMTRKDLWNTFDRMLNLSGAGV